MAAQEIPDSLSGFTGGWMAATRAVLERPEWQVPAWGRAFAVPGPVVVRGRLLSCPDPYYPGTWPNCADDRIGPYARPPSVVPPPLRRSLVEAGLFVCDSACPADGRTILALSPPLSIAGSAVRNAPDLEGRVVVEIHLLVPDIARPDTAYGRNALAILLHSNGGRWRLDRVQPLQRQRWPAADLVVPTRIPFRELEAVVGDTVRVPWKAVDALGRDVDFPPEWSARGPAIQVIDEIDGVFLAREMGRGMMIASAGSPPDGFLVEIGIDIREPPVAPGTGPAVTHSLVDAERADIYRAVLAHHCGADAGADLLRLDPRVLGRGEASPDSRHRESLLAELAERTCVRPAEESAGAGGGRGETVALSDPLLQTDGEVEVHLEVRVEVPPHPGDRLLTPSGGSGTTYRLARGAEGWRVVKVQLVWIS